MSTTEHLVTLRLVVAEQQCDQLLGEVRTALEEVCSVGFLGEDMDPEEDDFASLVVQLPRESKPKYVTGKLDVRAGSIEESVATVHNKLAALSGCGDFKFSVPQSHPCPLGTGRSPSASDERKAMNQTIVRRPPSYLIWD